MELPVCLMEEESAIFVKKRTHSTNRANLSDVQGRDCSADTGAIGTDAELKRFATVAAALAFKAALAQ